MSQTLHTQKFTGITQVQDIRFLERESQIFLNDSLYRFTEPYSIFVDFTRPQQGISIH